MEKDKIKVIIFDYDGPIVIRDIPRALAKIAEHFTDKAKALEFMKEKTKGFFEPKEIIAETLKKYKPEHSEEEAKSMLNEYLEVFDNGRLREGIKETLKELKTRYRLIVLSNGKLNKKVEEMKKFGILQYFESIYTEDNIGFKKPDINAFKAVLEKCNVQGKETVFIGDSVSNELVPAGNAGMNTILIRDAPFFCWLRDTKDLVKLL